MVAREATFFPRSHYFHYPQTFIRVVDVHYINATMSPQARTQKRSAARHKWERRAREHHWERARGSSQEVTSEIPWPLGGLGPEGGGRESFVLHPRVPFPPPLQVRSRGGDTFHLGTASPQFLFLIVSTGIYIFVEMYGSP